MAAPALTGRATSPAGHKSEGMHCPPPPRETPALPGVALPAEAAAAAALTALDSSSACPSGHVEHAAGPGPPHDQQEASHTPHDGGEGSEKPDTVEGAGVG